MPPNDSVNIHAKAEADVVRDLATRAVAPKGLNSGTLHVLVRPDGQVEYIDTEHLLDRPTRKRGTVTLHDSDSFTAFVNRHKIEGSTTIYADAFDFDFVAVLNDAEGETSGDNGAEWADHRAHLALMSTEEWRRWAESDGHTFTQEEFAEFIEEGIEQIHKPTAAEMLELATTFHATTSATFRQSTVLQSGERKLNYDESIEARSGRSGEMSVPATFELALRPFEGSPSYKVVARLRYRVNNGKLGIGYKLVRPSEIQRDAFNDEREKIADGTAVPTFAGTPVMGVGR